MKRKKLSKLEERNLKAEKRIKEQFENKDEEVQNNTSSSFDEQDQSFKKYLSFNYYLKRLEEQEKKNAVIPQLNRIGKGFYTMNEINAYAKTLKPFILPEIERLNNFNKKKHTKFKSWDEASTNYKFSEKDLLEYKDNINFYKWCKNNKKLIPKFSDKTKKILKDHFTVANNLVDDPLVHETLDVDR